jgi:hypothetical protein
MKSYVMYEKSMKKSFKKGVNISTSKVTAIMDD